MGSWSCVVFSISCAKATFLATEPDFLIELGNPWPIDIILYDFNLNIYELIRDNTTYLSKHLMTT